MNAPSRSIRTLALLVLTLLAVGSLRGAVKVERVPDGGLQPQTVLDEKGVVHLLYFKGEPKAGDLYYARRQPSSTNWETSLRVNSQPGSAIAIGTIRGGQLALGRNGRVHVAWNGSGEAQPKAPEGVPMLYSRLDDTGKAFEPQRNLMTKTRHLDGGGSLAADGAGNVYVAFHAAPLEGKADEATRAVFIARSKDDGKSFTAERQATTEPTGACACCGLKSYVSTDGTLYISYRAAREKVNRDMTLLTSRNAGDSFAVSPLGSWKGTTCPMSSTSLASDSKQLQAAWEIGSQVYLGEIDARSGLPINPVKPSGEGKRKHPNLAVNAAGQTLMVWTEGTGWNKGGSLAWQLFDSSHRPIGDIGRAPQVPTWSFATTFAVANDFVIAY